MIYEYEVITATEDGLLLIDDYKTRINALRLDNEKTRRLKTQVCKPCWYILRPKKGAHVPTISHCKECGEKLRSNTTVTDTLCLKCAKKLELCKECGAFMTPPAGILKELI